MSHLYDTIEPNAISEALLKKCVTEQGPQGEVGKVANAEGIAFTEVTHLRLDFKNILHIENLWQFTNLRKLLLDNNIIEEVCGLEMMTQLEWLDLSFNNIEEISGLDKLINLRDLSLANNRLKTIENIDSLSGSLQILSVANNLIEDKKNVQYLRKFGKLQTLALKGNPLAEHSDYVSHVVAFIPSVVYIDFRIVTQDEKQQAQDLFADELLELEYEETGDARRREAEQAAEEKGRLLTCAYVNGLQGSTLFHSMFVEDVDAHKIAVLPGISVKLKQFEESFITICEHLTKVGLEEKEKRDKEVALFREAHKEACLKVQELSVEKVKEFEEAKQMTASSMTPGEWREKMDSLEHTLMWLEMQLVEQLDESSKDFELNYGDMVSAFKENVQSHMTQLRELENHHHEEVTDLALSTLERFAKSQLEGELVDDLRTLLVDKDTLVSALNTAHDTHLLAIDNKEDDIARRAGENLSRILEDIQTTELARNRMKVSEIDKYMERERIELGNSASPGTSPYL